MIPLTTISLAFFTGLTTGGLSCLAIQGGLMSSVLAKTPQKGYGLAAFLGAKLVSYTILGFLLGALGEGLTISLATQGYLQIFAGMYMLASSAQLLNLHPIFRYTVIQPPQFLFRFAKGSTKAESLFTPAIVGFLTILLPCGVTQSMMILSLSSGNGIHGAVILGAFTLATIPQFLALGAAASIFLSKRVFQYAAAIVIAYLGVVSINTGQILRGSNHTIQNYVYVLTSATKQVEGAAPISDGVQSVRIDVASNGYQSSSQILKAGVPVKLTLVSNKTQGCARAFSIPSLGISKVLPETGEETITFTPQRAGLLTYSCNMGMYVGNFQVVS